MCGGEKGKGGDGKLEETREEKRKQGSLLFSLRLWFLFSFFFSLLLFLNYVLFSVSAARERGGCQESVCDSFFFSFFLFFFSRTTKRFSVYLLLSLSLYLSFHSMPRRCST